MEKHEKLNYVEFAAVDLVATQSFFSHVFNWTFESFGSEYIAFNAKKAGLDGGFYKADLKACSNKGSALLVFYSVSLEDTQARVVEHGGNIVKTIFSFPGGRRFHFCEPSGNEFAVWSDQ